MASGYTKESLIKMVLCLLFLSILSYGQVIESWVARYDGPGNRFDGAFAIAVDGSGNVYVTGGSRGDGTSSDYTTIKYDTDGNELWVRRYNGPGNSNDAAHAIALDGSGNVYITGGSTVDYATIKYDTGGNELWVKRYNGPADRSDVAFAIAVDDLGNVYVTGWSEEDGTADYATIKYDTGGNWHWVRRYNGPGNEYECAYAIAVDNVGNVYVTGVSTGVGTKRDYATIKYVQINTPVGTNVVVKPTDNTIGSTPAIVIFDNVTQSGQTTLTTSASGFPPPSGFELGEPPTYYEFTTTALYEGNITVCIDYSDISYGDENNLKLFHYEGGNWVDCTISLDTDLNIICARVASFSAFAIFE